MTSIMSFKYRIALSASAILSIAYLNAFEEGKKTFQKKSSHSRNKWTKMYICIKNIFVERAAFMHKRTYTANIFIIIHEQRV